MPAEEGIRTLQRILDRDETTVAVADVEWQDFLVGYTAARPRPLVEDLPQVRAVRAEKSRARAAGAGDSGRTVAELTGEERESALAELVRRTAAEVLGHADPSAVTDDRRFVELGLDSVSAVDIRNRLSLTTGLSLPATLVFDHPTVPETCAFLSRALDDHRSARIPPPAARTPEIGRASCRERV